MFIKEVEVRVEVCTVLFRALGVRFKAKAHPRPGAKASTDDAPTSFPHSSSKERKIAPVRVFVELQCHNEI